MHADARGPEPTGGGAASRSQEDAQENIGESGGQSRIQRGGQGRSPSQSLGGQAKRAHLRPSLVRLRSSSNRKCAGRAKVNSSGRSSDNRRFSQSAASREETQMTRGTLMVAAGLVLGVGNGLKAHHCFGLVSVRPKPVSFGEVARACWKAGRSAVG